MGIINSFVWILIYSLGLTDAIIKVINLIWSFRFAFFLGPKEVNLKKHKYDIVPLWVTVYELCREACSLFSGDKEPEKWAESNYCHRKSGQEGSSRPKQVLGLMASRCANTLGKVAWFSWLKNKEFEAANWKWGFILASNAASWRKFFKINEYPCI